MYAHIARIYAYGVGYGVVCSDVKAMLEPRNAEQQDCSPAFCVYKMYSYAYVKNIC